MERYFEIMQGYTHYGARLPISSKVREYFETFFSENVLQKEKIIIGGKWKVKLAIIFLGTGSKAPKDIFSENKPTTISAEHVKKYTVLTPTHEIDSAENKYLKSIELVFRSIREFLLTNYKKIKADQIDALWQKVDLGYLLSLPYPAPEDEQKYVGDEMSKYP